jgi:hypothetical protein
VKEDGIPVPPRAKKQAEPLGFEETLWKAADTREPDARYIEGDALLVPQKRHRVGFQVGQGFTRVKVAETCPA